MRRDDLAQRAGAAHGAARRAVEDREEAVADALDDVAVEGAQRSPDLRVVDGEQVAPALVAERGGARGAADDVREEHGQQRPLLLAPRRPPVRNSSISPSTASVSPALGSESTPGSSTSCAPGIRRAYSRPWRTSTKTSSVRCRTRVGARIEPSSGRTSVWRAAVDEPARLAGARREALQAREPPRICGSSAAVGARTARFVPSPQRSMMPGEAPVALLVGLDPRQLLVADDVQQAAVQHERADAVGVAGGVHRGERPAGVVREHRGPLALRRVEHRVDVADLVLDAQRRRCPTAPSRACRDDEPRELRQARQEAREARVLPDVLDMRDERADEQQVDRTVAVHLVGEVDVPVARVVRCRDRHRRCIIDDRPRLFEGLSGLSRR